MDHYSQQSSFLLAFILNPSDNLGGQSVLIIFFIIERTGDMYLIFCQELGVYKVLHYFSYCLFWQCGPIFVLKITGVIWDVVENREDTGAFSMFALGDNFLAC